MLKWKWIYGDDVGRYRGIKTYAHCKNGHGRTTTFLASYFIRKLGLSTDEALRLAKERRPSAHLNEVQESFLRGFEKGIIKEK